MAGILDFLQTPEAQMGIGLLAAGGPSTTPMNVGQRVQMAMQGMNAQQQNALKMKLLQSQVDENASQNALRQGQMARQARQDAYFLGGAMPSASAAPGGVMAPPAGVPALGDAANAGAALKAAAGKPADAPPPPQGKFAEWSKQYNIPIDALISDYFSNGGKNIADMIYKRGTPDMQVSNGFAYDKNKLPGGFMPQINTSSNGQTSMILPSGPGGSPVVSAPDGAVNTFAAYQGVQDRSKAQNTPGRPVILPGGRMGGQSQFSEINGAPPVGVPTAWGGMPGAQPGVTGNFSGDPSKIVGAIADIRDPQERANAMAALQQQIQAQAGGPNASLTAQMPGGGLEFSPTEQADAKASERFKTGVADAAAKNVETSQAQAQSASATLQNVEQIRSGLDKALLGPGAKIGVALMQVGHALGVGGKDSAETLSNTRSVIQGLARQELSAAGQMKGQGQITESERGILRRAEAGEIDNFTKPELSTLLGALEKTAKYRLQSHESLIGQVKSGASPTDLMSVRPPNSAAPASPAAGVLPPGWTVKVR